MIINDNKDEEKETEEGIDKKGKWTVRNIPDHIKNKLNLEARKMNIPVGDYLTYLVEIQETSIHHVSKDAKDILTTEAASVGVTQADYINMILLSQNTTIRNIDPEAMSAAMMVAARAHVSLSQFVSNAILKEAHDIVQGKNNKPIATVPGEEVMTVDKVEALMKDFKSEVIDIIRELKKEETFFDKLKGLMK